MKNWEQAFKTEKVSAFYFWLSYCYNFTRQITIIFYGFFIFYPLTDDAFISSLLITFIPFHWVSSEVNRMEREWWQHGTLRLSTFLMLFILPLFLYKTNNVASVTYSVLMFFNLLFAGTFMILECVRRPHNVPKNKVNSIRKLNGLLQPLLYLKEEKVHDVLSHIDDLSEEDKEKVLEHIRNKSAHLAIDYILAIYIKK